MCGAIALAGKAALRTGAGKVTVATPRSCRDLVAGFEPCYMTIALPEDDEGRLDSSAGPRIARALAHADCFVLGPGMGHSPDLVTLVREIFVNDPRPGVVDADGLNCLADAPERVPTRGGGRVLTPHPGEFRRLVVRHELSVEEVRHESPLLAAELRSVLVCKGNRSLVTDGSRQFLNPTGNPGMATAGAGDVLSGMIAALMGQGLDPYAAACLGVYLHGLAGDLAAAELGQESLIASDLLQYLPQAFGRYRSTGNGIP